MSLAEEFAAKSGGYEVNHWDVAKELNAEQVHYDILDTTRWGQIVEYVYMRGLEYARVEYEEAGGEGETEYEPEWTAVRPVTKTIITYQELD